MLLKVEKFKSEERSLVKFFHDNDLIKKKVLEINILMRSEAKLNLV